ncbi:hypothetical protein CERSUDRAFT_69910 [Gelatoporia subvermispora B]|uniref:Uncharacterized protein n=1 Tax=Ceriporiopsis subvermispora (strain B) TaxID=914234 RepID=M2RR12_CERS8|nr:hypothetical protein CERSUDRAFT_69910 [Gelatoporia subvermispora B]
MCSVMGLNESDKAKFIDQAVDSRAYSFDYRFMHLPAIGGSGDSNAQNFVMTANTLATQYRDGVRLNGVIYLADGPSAADVQSDFDLTQKLCGNNFMSNFVIATDPVLLVKCKWGEVFGAGARGVPYDIDYQSVHHVLRHWYKRARKTLLVQSEMIDQGLDIGQTSAGQALHRALLGKLEVHLKDLRRARAWTSARATNTARGRIAHVLQQLQALGTLAGAASLLRELPSSDSDLVPQAPSPPASIPGMKTRNLEEQVQAMAEELKKMQGKLTEAEQRIETLERQIRDTTTVVIPPLPELGPETMTIRIKLT